MALGDGGGIFGSGLSGGDLAGAAKGVAGAAGDLFGAKAQTGGYEKEADLYDAAAAQEGWNSTYAQESGDIQKILATRQYNETFGAQKAAAGANGFQESGSNLALMRQGWNTFGITKGQIALQTGINVANYKEQQLGYEAQAAGARSAAQASQGGGIMDILGKVVGIAGGLLMSDMRLKTDIAYLHTQKNGIRWYTFKFIGSNEEHVGVMAQEVLEILPNAVYVAEDGYYRVDYAAVLRTA